MTSAQFLMFYALASVLVLAVAWWVIRGADDSTAAGREPLPRNFDPQEIAFLRGDANELVRFTVFELTYGGLLTLGPAAKRRDAPISRTAKYPGTQLDPIEQIVYDFFDQPRTATDLFRSDVPTRIEAAFKDRRDGLAARHLLTDDKVREAAKAVRLFGALAIAGIGAYRLAYAFSQHHRNIGFTIALGFIALFGLMLVTRVPRLSRRGRAYVKTLRAAFPPNAPALSPAFPVVVAAGGMALLAGTPYAGLSQTFRRAGTSDPTSGCGSASSSSCSSGSSGCGGGGGCGGG